MLVSVRLLHQCSVQSIRSAARSPGRCPQPFQWRRLQYQDASPKRFLATAKRPPPKKPAAKPAPRPTEAAAVKQTPPPSPKPFAGVQGRAPPTPDAGHGYPLRLLIYHAGTGKTVFLACLRLTSIFFFIFSAVLISPAYYFDPLEPTYMAAITLFAGAIPMLITVFSTAPFVAYVHLKLPAWARASQPRLLRYVQHLPGSAELDFTSVRWIWPRVTRLHANELYVNVTKAGTMTLRRTVPEEVKRLRRWYHWRPLTKFYVAGRSGKTVEKAPVWEYVVGCIAKGFPKRERQHLAP